MPRVKIYKKDGSETPFFWSDNDRGDRKRQTVYKQTPDGVKKMRGVHFDVDKNRMRKE